MPWATIVGSFRSHMATETTVMKEARRLTTWTVCAWLAVCTAPATAAETAGTDGSGGAQLWAHTCARCHNMRDPQEFRDDQWRVIVTHMRVRAGLTGADARKILAFLQASNVPTAVRSGKSGGDAVQRGVLRSADGPVVGDATTGARVYGQTCVACHGADGKGALPGVVDLTPSDGPLSQPDTLLYAAIRDGFQSPSSSLAMPAKGGNPALTERDIHDVVAYLRETFRVASRSDR